MAFRTVEILVPPVRVTKGGDPYVELFFIQPASLSYDPIHSGTSTHRKSLADAKMLFHRKLGLIQIFFSSSKSTSTMLCK